MRWILILLVYGITLTAGIASSAQERPEGPEQRDDNGTHAERGANSSGPGVNGRRTGTDDGNVHIVYALDTSAGMRDKIVKSKVALKKAIGQLRQTDTFNIITFSKNAVAFRNDLAPATPANVGKAVAYVDAIQAGGGTNISAAVELALGMTGTTLIYLMAASGPDSGITGDDELLRYIREKNIRGVKVTTLALGLGEDFAGMKLLKRIADENNGSYSYINLSKVDYSPDPPPAKLVKKKVSTDRSRGRH